MIVGVAILVIFGWIQSGQAQDISRACLRSTSAGGASINCLKASVLLQRAQLQALRNIRDAIARSSNRSTAVANTNAVRTQQALELMTKSLQAVVTQTVTYPFINDLTTIKGRSFDCLSGECAKDAKVVAERICRQLNFAGQHAFQFEDGENVDAPKRMQWVACRR